MARLRSLSEYGLVQGPVMTDCRTSGSVLLLEVSMTEKSDSYERWGSILGVTLSIAAYAMVIYPLLKWWLG
jgi:hypothetical protein